MRHELAQINNTNIKLIINKAKGQNMSERFKAYFVTSPAVNGIILVLTSYVFKHFKWLSVGFFCFVSR